MNHSDAQAIAKLVAQVNGLRAQLAEIEADRDMKVAAIGAALKHAEARAERSEQHVAKLIEASHDAIEWLLDLGADKTHEDARHIERLAAAQRPPEGPA